MADVPLTRRDLLTTKGDLYVHDGTDLIRVGVGADDQVLTADAAAASGVKWAAASGGGGSSGIWEHIGTATSATAGGAITVDSISTDYNAFRIWCDYEAASGTTNVFPGLRFNNDSGSNYLRQRGEWNGAPADAQAIRSTGTLVTFSVGSFDAGARGAANATVYKAASGVPAVVLGDFRGRTSANISFGSIAAEWTNTASKITRIDLVSTGGDLAAGSRMIVEGTTQ